MQVALVCTVVSQVQHQMSEKEQINRTPDKYMKERETGREPASHESVDCRKLKDIKAKGRKGKNSGFDSASEGHVVPLTGWPAINESLI